MRKSLTKKDIKELRDQCRMGYIIPSLLFMIGTGTVYSIYEFYFNKNSVLNFEALIIIALLFAVFSVAISYGINWKYLTDIKNNAKVIEKKVILKKESKRDYEAGSGTLYIGQEMNGFDSFSIIVDNCRYRVESEFFDNCAEGDEVYFNYGLISKHLISIELNDVS